MPFLSCALVSSCFEHYFTSGCYSLQGALMIQSIKRIEQQSHQNVQKPHQKSSDWGHRDIEIILENYNNQIQIFERLAWKNKVVDLFSVALELHFSSFFHFTPHGLWLSHVLHASMGLVIFLIKPKKALIFYKCMEIHGSDQLIPNLGLDFNTD